MNKLKQDFHLAFIALKSNLTRSLLTMLGIVVGIAAVIALVAVGMGVQETILGNFEKIGASTVVIMPKINLLDDSQSITFNDIQAIRDQVPMAKYVAPLSRHRGSVRTHESDFFPLYIYGMDNDGFNLLSPDMIYGRSLTPIDYQDGLPNCLIDEYNATVLYGDPSMAVDQEIEVVLSSGLTARLNIVGVGTFDSLNLITNMAQDLGSQEKDQSIVSLFIPMTGLARLSGSEENAQVLFVMAQEPGQAESAGNLALQILERRHNTEGQDKYQVQNMAGIVDQLSSSLTLISTLVSVVASISLLVAGIGVMNVMLVNVTERTREIGIRKALGATPRDIARQFLSEAIILTSSGGVFGIVSGLLLAKILASYMNISPKFNLGWSIAALVFSAAIGLIFGLAPAKRAADMHPIDALRYE